MYHLKGKMGERQKQTIILYSLNIFRTIKYYLGYERSAGHPIIKDM